MPYIDNGRLHFTPNIVPPDEGDSQPLDVNVYTNAFSKFFAKLFNKAVDVEIDNKTYCVNIKSAKSRLSAYIPEAHKNLPGLDEAIAREAVLNCINDEKDRKEISSPQEAAEKLRTALDRAKARKDLKPTEFNFASLSDKGEIEANQHTSGNIQIASAGKKDPSISIMEFETSKRIKIFGILEGEGGNNANKLLEIILADRLNFVLDASDYAVDSSSSDEAIMNAIRIAFNDANDELKKEVPNHNGSTALICIQIGNNIWTANVGDSRAIITGDLWTTALSEDQKMYVPGNLDDLQKIPKDNIVVFEANASNLFGVEIEDNYRYTRRAINRGAHVKQQEGKFKALSSISSSIKTTHPRVFGYPEVVGLTAKPIITKWPLQPGQGTNRLIIASSELWSVATSTEVGNYAKGSKSAQEVAQGLANKAASVAPEDVPTVLVVDFR